MKNSRHVLPLLMPLLLVAQMVKAQDYQKAWDALAKNDRKAARLFLENAQKTPDHAADAALTLLLLEALDSRERTSRPFLDAARQTLKDPYPYYYALWHNHAVAGPSSIFKMPEQVKFLEGLLEDPRCPAMLQASARYQLSFQYNAQSDFKAAKDVTFPISNVKNWQFTGPFDNVSESGFDKNYPPIALPGKDARFKSTNQAEIEWFTPGVQSPDGWVMLGYNIKWSTGIVYAQSFVTAPADMEAELGAGFTGSCKIWLNDQLVLSEQEARITDFDVYKVKCTLKKGANRVLVQIGMLENEFTNFCVRFLNKDGQPLNNIQSSPQEAAYPKSTGPLPNVQPFFAETFFQQKVAAEPDNLLNYCLLTETYLRSRKNQEALATIEQAMAKAPNNMLLRFERLQCYLKLNNRTFLTQEMEDFKRLVPEDFISLQWRYHDAFENERYDEAQALLDRSVALYGVDEKVYEQRIKLAIGRKKYEEALKWISEAYKLYPSVAFFVEVQHNVELSVRKDPEAARHIYENFLKKDLNTPLALALAREYVEYGLGNDAIRVLEKLDAALPNVTLIAEQAFDYFYSIKDHKNAQKWLDKMLSLAPFHGEYWEYAARLSEQMENKAEALSHLKKALAFNPNNFDARRQIRELASKSDFPTLLPQYDVYELLTKTDAKGKEGEYDWYYVLDEQCTILHPEHTSETYATLLIKILHEKGIERWKESSISYDSERQRLIIEKAEVIKPNGSKVVAEENGNELVFPNLEVGDGLYIRYRLLNYAYGRMAREFWNSYYFNGFVPVDISRYCLLTPQGLPLEIKNVNTDIEPKIQALPSENMTLYTWESHHEPAMADESLTPASSDISKVVHISTLPQWEDISNWYGDISAIQAKRDYEVKHLAKELFPPGKSLTETQKVKAIYTWIIKNIRYSSVAFRQSGYVPQRASKVIQTKLGDCKDLATLFVALAREVGLQANLVLLSTRDQGLHSMALPSMAFNHCIAKVTADGQVWYLELTNPHLPFGALPNSDYKALAFDIPFEGTIKGNKPYQLDPPNRLKDERFANTTIEFNERNMIVTVQGTRRGAPAELMRDSYEGEPKQKQTETMQEALAPRFSNTLSILAVNFGDLGALNDTLQFKVQYQVKNEVAEIGSLGTFKIPFYDIFFRADAFPDNPRTLPVSYWEYEDADQYKEEILVRLPIGKSFVEIPKDVSLSFGGMTYQLRYVQIKGEGLRVIREIHVKRDNISAADYPKFREFAEAVVNAETRLVGFR